MSEVSELFRLRARTDKGDLGGDFLGEWIVACNVEFSNGCALCFLAVRLILLVRYSEYVSLYSICIIII